MSRRLVRSEAVKYIYAKTLNSNFGFSDFKESFCKIKKFSEKEDLERLVFGLLKIESTMESIVGECASDYDKLSVLEKSILKVCAYEFVYTDLPKNVAIDEAVEIAKEFGDDNTKAIVNAILECVGRKYEK